MLKMFLHTTYLACIITFKEEIMQILTYEDEVLDFTSKKKLSFLDRAKLITYIEMVENTYTALDLPNVIEKYGYASDNIRAKAFIDGNRIVLAFKGTTPSLLGFGTGKTAVKDKLFDTAAFSCCIDALSCVKKKRALKESHYIEKAREILQLVQDKYRAPVIITGHSMGGAIASILAMEASLPAVAFSSPGEKHLSRLIDINNNANVVHVGMENDIIYTGKCNGKYSICEINGYQFNTKCHMGRAYAILDTMNETILTHTVAYLKHKLLSTSDLEIMEVDHKDCVDCSTF